MMKTRKTKSINLLMQGQRRRVAMRTVMSLTGPLRMKTPVTTTLLLLLLLLLLQHCVSKKDLRH